MDIVKILSPFTTFPTYSTYTHSNPAQSFRHPHKQSFKKWIGIPRSATNVVIDMQQTLDIKSISQLYTETHTVSHVRTRLHGDLTVNNAINSTLDRESTWTRKQSTAVQCEEAYVAAKNLHTVEGEMPEFTGEDSVKLQCQFNIKVSTSVKKHMEEEHMRKCSEKVKSLAVQGQNLAQAAAEKNDFTWKSTIYNRKAGTLKFLVNAVIDTLPTAANLVRWKKSTSDKCKLCKGRQTTAHA